jgi:hypothetical protein
MNRETPLPSFEVIVGHAILICDYDCHCLSCCQSRNRAWVDVVAAGDVAERFAPVAALLEKADMRVDKI